ncbi:MAG: UDP-N-acetylmuramate--L-alanine ligase [Chlamydiales bacterium]|nr:UDP-N-acetylmuramate--L-alanine ligase [Chlamydiales bacterium]MCH9619867.1 UDP-N-acetylmuramate--L-alanine ligase [Chlamydiales bacterium]MCH9622706.1 UDP-N-acetylmuramate--L-alanine ligase [Chlamydiales bacterium]
MKKYHFIGIGGIGMSALAHILLEEKQSVSGSDLNLGKMVAKLEKKGAQIAQGGIAEDATVVYSSAVIDSNPDYRAAKQAGLKMLHRSELLAELIEGKTSCAVAGTHGKTTVSSLLVHVLMEAKRSPSFALGGLLGGDNGRSGKSDLFVFEADESDGSFLSYHPTHAIITNIEAEHLDHFGDEKRLREAFEQFSSQVGGESLVCGIDYGFEEHCPFRILMWEQKGWQLQFDLHYEGKIYSEIKVPLIGEHNVLNATAVFAMALKLGVEEEKIREALSTFPGVTRRCEQKKEELEILFIDDYAHHPTEVKTTLNALRAAAAERRIVALYQPHRFSRTRDQIEAYKEAFDGADHTFITDIYSAGETPIEGVSGEVLAKKVGGTYLPKEKWQELENFLRPHDIFISMGAGDVTDLELHPRTKYRLGVVYGGKSFEHDISVTTAKCVMDALDTTLYDVETYFIDKGGKWNGKNLSSIIEELNQCDVLLPILHGTYGEDGRVQSLFELLEKPYIGPNWEASALCMHKMHSKIIAKAAGVLTPKGFSFRRGEEWKSNVDGLTFPLFVKPNHMGSSVGISKVERFEDLEDAVENAFLHDDEVLIEEGMQNCREIEFPVIGNQHVVVPKPGEKLANGAFVDYRMKYTKGVLEATTEPDLDPEVLAKGRWYAELVYRKIGCSGFARVDFFLDQKNQWWFFEINPIPGMQQLSLFPKVWNREGVSYQKMLDRMIILGLERERQCIY